MKDQITENDEENKQKMIRRLTKKLGQSEKQFEDVSKEREVLLARIEDLSEENEKLRNRSNEGDAEIVKTQADLISKLQQQIQSLSNNPLDFSAKDQYINSLHQEIDELKQRLNENAAKVVTPQDSNAVPEKEKTIIDMINEDSDGYSEEEEAEDSGLSLIHI